MAWDSVPDCLETGTNHMPTRSELVFDKHGRSDTKEGREAIGKELAWRVHATYKQGGEGSYRYALAMWQTYNALYPDYVTDKDHHKRVKGLWEDPVDV